MRKLRTQISAIIMLMVFFTVAAISFLSNIIINREFEKYIANKQTERANELVSDFKNQYNSLTDKWNVEYIHGAGMYALYDGYIIKVYDKKGLAVWDAGNHDMAICTQIMKDITSRMEARRPEIGGKFISYDYELSMNGQKIGIVTISYYGPYFLSESDFNFLDTLNFILIAIGAVSLVAALIISGILARRMARPIAKTAQIAKQISEGNYAIRFEGKIKTKEIDELTDAINCLAGGLAKQESLRKRLTADVAHELRTPLAALSSYLEAMIEGVWEPTIERLRGCYEETARLSGLVSDLESLAKTESENLILNKTEIDLMDIVRFSCNNFELEMKKKNLSLSIEGNPVSVYADKDRLNQVMANLISNALKYTYEGGNINIKVEDEEETAILIIEDDGIGIAEHELALIFERFYRTDESRNRKTGGAGIGLAIVKSIITAHGGTITAEKRHEGGSRFIIKLPKDSHYTRGR